MDKVDNKHSRLNRLIRNVAVRGNVGPIDINWKTCSRFIFVLIEEFTGKW